MAKSESHSPEMHRVLTHLLRSQLSTNHSHSPSAPSRKWSKATVSMRPLKMAGSVCFPWKKVSRCMARWRQGSLVLRAILPMHLRGSTGHQTRPFSSSIHRKAWKMQRGWASKIRLRSQQIRWVKATLIFWTKRDWHRITQVNWKTSATWTCLTTCISWVDHMTNQTC